MKRRNEDDEPRDTKDYMAYVRLDDALQTRLDRWREKQKMVPSQSEAIRYLMGEGLTAEGEPE